MSINIYTYSNPYKLKDESYWTTIKDSFQICVSQTMVNGLKSQYTDFRTLGQLTTITNFMNAPEYDALVEEIAEARKNKHTVKEVGDTYRAGPLLKKNIFMNHAPATKEEIIREIGQIFLDGGYTTDKYTQAMLDKEETFNTAIGNNVAIPHGIESMRGEIKNTGLVIMTFPEGIDWGDGETVKLVIGIAAVGDEHMDVLQKIAQACEDEEAVDAILAKSTDDVYEMFK